MPTVNPAGLSKTYWSDVEAGIPLRVATRIRGTCINDQALILSHLIGLDFLAKVHSEPLGFDLN